MYEVEAIFPPGLPNKRVSSITAEKKMRSHKKFVFLGCYSGAAGGCKGPISQERIPKESLVNR